MIGRKLSFPLLIVPGLGGSGPGHWQSLWASQFDDAETVHQLSWDRPDIGMWLHQLRDNVARNPGAILVGHSLGSILIAHLAREVPHLNIAGALLVAPADVETCVNLPACVARFGPIPDERLPFPAAVVASTDDPYLSITRAHFLARSWGAQFFNVGSCGHINVAAGFGSWPEGEHILAMLTEQIAFERRTTRRSARRLARTA